MKTTKLIAVIATVLSVAQTYATAQTTNIFTGTTNITTAVNGQPFNTNAQFALFVSIRGTIIAQSTNSTVNSTNGTITTTPAQRQFFSTSNILRTLGNDASISGRITGTNFAPGASLILSNNTFFVLSGSDVIDVSDIMTFQTGTNQLISGSTDANGLATPRSRTIIEIGRVTFNDTAINTNNGLVFYFQGVATQTTGNSVANATTGEFTEARSLNLNQGTGEGTENVGSGSDRLIIISGGVLTARGNGTGNITTSSTASTETTGTTATSRARIITPTGS